MSSVLFFFFFSSRRRHTRLTCDWSSDVCSSDLRAVAFGGRDQPLAGDIDLHHGHRHRDALAERVVALLDIDVELLDLEIFRYTAEDRKSGRVGKECRSRWAPEHEKKKKRQSM